MSIIITSTVWAVRPFVHVSVQGGWGSRGPPQAGMVEEEGKS